MEKRYGFKSLDLIDDMQDMNPALLIVLSYVATFLNAKGIQPTLTRIIDKKIQGFSVSTTHEEGRAFDMSVRNIDEKTIRELCAHINCSLECIGAISADGVPRVAVYEDGITQGCGAHIHLQCRRDAESIILKSELRS
jgi:hypothetical protein